MVDTSLKLEKHDLAKNNITVQVEASPEMKKTYADPGQLQEVFINLIVNAKAGMKSAHGGGALAIRTRRDSSTITIEIEDDGPGIPIDDLGSIFDPFFTTRSPAEGTGLGLSICHGIINEHGGRISVRSKTGEGATFVVELPVLDDEDETETGESEA